MRSYIHLMLSATMALLGILFLSTLSQPAQAATYNNLTPSTISCANVRCAGGSCTDTPGGPVCGPQVTCANVLCKQGTSCQMKSSGPTCVPNNVSPIPRPHCQWGTRINRYGHTVCRANPYKSWKRKHYNRHYYGHYPRRPRYAPPRYNPPRYNPPRYQPPRYTPPRYNPTPTPTPSEPRICPQYYDPICGIKRVQCFRAPCPAPVTQTFGNSCQMQGGDFTVLHKGECR